LPSRYHNYETSWRFPASAFVAKYVPVILVMLSKKEGIFLEVFLFSRFFGLGRTSCIWRINCNGQKL
jgi:hypothetical protein